MKMTINKTAVLLLTSLGLVSGCKKAPQHIHNGPEYHRVNQHLIVPIDVRQSHDADDSQNINLSAPVPTGGPKLNLNFPGKNTSNQNVTNNTSKTSNRVNARLNNRNNVQNPPPPYTE